MSDEPKSSVSNLLRQYRFKKTTPNSPNQTNGTENQPVCNSDLKLVPGKKRILHVANDSSSDEGNSPSKPQQPEYQQLLSVKDKEELLIAVKTEEPDYDTMHCQDALVRANWNLSGALKYLRDNFPKKRRIQSPSTSSISTTATATSSNTSSLPVAHANEIAKTAPSSTLPVQQHRNGVTSQKHKIKYRSKDRGSDDSEMDSDNDNGKPKEMVFNSDDDDSDDAEVSYVMTKDRKRVYEFLSTATLNELQAVKTCSAKKADAIMELRPFDDWADLITKIKESRLGTEILNHCQEFLTRRNNMMNIMKKCNKMVQRLEIAVEAGGGLTSQPFILNPNYKLADYQLVGLNWLAVMHKEGMNGILADEMGLGKTIQVISFLAYLKETDQTNCAHLVVVPSSTLDNWMNEFARWCPDLIVEKYYGSAEERRSLRIQWLKRQFKDIDVILTTYHTVSASPEERKMFRVTKMQYVIFDEAHMLKNMTTQRYAHLFRINAERRLLLTGTPLQNNLLELMSLLCFVMPSVFANNTEDIKSLFQKNLKIKGEEDTSTFEQTQIDQAKRIMKPFVLRRLKIDVLNSLPKKSEISIKVPLTNEQKERYKVMVREYSTESGVVQSSNERSGISIMMDMRKLANHPLLMRYYYDDDKVRLIAKQLSNNPTYKKNPHPQYIFEELAILSDFQLLQTIEKYDLSYKGIPDKLIMDSGKFKKLDELLSKLKSEGHRVLIFSQFVMMLDILERYLDIRDHAFLRIDGQTPVNERQNLIDRYMQDKDLFVFLLSTRAGGLGINLTAADTVIIHDIDFNPYNDKQAEDRCHRMGQKKPVTIYRLVSEGTIEEGMMVVAQDKLNLEREVTSNEGDAKKEHKCMVRLLTMALGMDENKAEILLSPKKDPSSSLMSEYFANE